MSGHQYATIEDTVYFWFGANDTSGSGGDGASPVFDVREAGAAAGAIPLLSGSATLLSHANFPAGCHEIAVAATTGNGFAAGDTFAVFCTLLIDSQNPVGFVGSCTLTPLAKTSELAKVPKSDGAVSWNATALAAIEAEALDALEGVQLDHLVGVTTGVAADSDLETYCVAGSLLAHLFSVGADITTFKPSTDSPEALRNHVGDGTNLPEAGGDGDHLSAIPRIEADLTYIHGTALTETAGQLAAAFKKFFNVAAPTATALSLPDAVPDAAGGLPVSDAGGLDLDTKLANTNEVTVARMGALTDWINGGRLDLLLDAVKVVTDALTAASATLLALSAGTIVPFTVSWDNTNATTTVFYSDDITEATADHFNGRQVIFITGDLQYQATSIEDYELDTGEGKFTVVALTEAPADNVTGIIV